MSFSVSLHRPLQTLSRAAFYALIDGFLTGRRYRGEMEQSHHFDRPHSASADVRGLGHGGGERLTALQSLRGIAALLVLFHHVAQTAGPAMTQVSASLRQGLGPLGSAGVDLFFVISGFVIAHGVSSTRAPTSHRFLAGRAIRILPLFWLVSAAFAWQLWLAGFSFPLPTISNTITLIPLPGQRGFSYPILYVGWSLAFELIFYLLAGLMLMVPRNRRVPSLLASLCGLAALGMVVKGSGGPAPFFANIIFLEFAFGVSAWFMWRRGIGTAAAALLAFLGFLLLLSGALSFGQGIETDPALIISQATSGQRALAFGLPAAMILLGIVAFSNDRPATGGWLSRLGDASFSLYLIHPVVLFAAEHWRPLGWIGNDLLFLLTLTILSLGAAAMLHIFVERPIIRWGNNVTRGRPNGRATKPPPQDGFNI
jgi:peptidoglycan/LPS O-acetylase OafA/YrhL